MEFFASFKAWGLVGTFPGRSVVESRPQSARIPFNVPPPSAVSRPLRPWQLKSFHPHRHRKPSTTDFWNSPLKWWWWWKVRETGPRLMEKGNLQVGELWLFHLTRPHWKWILFAAQDGPGGVQGWTNPNHMGDGWICEIIWSKPPWLGVEFAVDFPGVCVGPIGVTNGVDVIFWAWKKCLKMVPWDFWRWCLPFPGVGVYSQVPC